MDHSPGFLKLASEAKKSVHEITVADARAKLATNPKVVLVDVREDHEWAAGHAVEAVTVGAVGEESQRYDAPRAVGAVYRDRADRIVYFDGAVHEVDRADRPERPRSSQ